MAEDEDLDIELSLSPLRKSTAGLVNNIIHEQVSKVRKYQWIGDLGHFEGLRVSLNPPSSTIDKKQEITYKWTSLGRNFLLFST